LLLVVVPLLLLLVLFDVGLQGGGVSQSLIDRGSHLEGTQQTRNETHRSLG